MLKRFIGLPYLWGGVSTFGVMIARAIPRCCRRRGVMLPRDAGPQARSSVVVTVSKESLQPGDLLYFGESENKITHTGMYIGNGQFINATAWQKPVVQVCDLSDPHWTKLLVACRRLK